ncbi:trimethylamine methyltransferase family protein [Rhodospirillaceae bacterium SYSU D60014]|uniref:trimethylamine methyltransferase family protein n=1 Tax=Virgifigura deserti TaxID=2268457 RepID=UPI000E6710CD
MRRGQAVRSGAESLGAAGGPRRRSRREVGGLKQLPWRNLVNPYKPIEVLTPEQLDRIHDASMRILETYGLEFLNDEALGILEKAGATVDRSNNRVRFDRGLIADYVAKAPSEFTLHARNPARNVRIGGANVNFCTVSGAPNCSDLDRGRRPGSFADFSNLLKLAHSLNIIHVAAGYPVEPIDIPPSIRHLDCHYAYITLTDRVWQPSGIGPHRVLDGIAMNCIARGISREELAEKPGLLTTINTNSPLRVDGAMLDGLMAMARHGQANVITPFTLSGAMAPATLAGALAQQNAEALGVIAFTQMVRAGAPVLYGGFTSNVDMKSGAPAFGTPEYTLGALAGGQLARRYGLPYRSSAPCAANAVDAQAAYETEMSAWGAVMGHASLVKHGAGWMEGGLVASFEKMIVDAEILQMMAELLQPIEVNDDTLGLDAIAEVGPGGHFFGAAHTLARYETAFYAPILSDWRNFESWREAGAQDTAQRANALWKRILADYTPPPLDPAIDEELQAFIAKRKEEGGIDMS